ncbi:MAG: LuxR C-terminal-related transcriptional regulator [Actinomycetes bacterium]
MLRTEIPAMHQAHHGYCDGMAQPVRGELTPQERTVLAAVERRLTNPEIAAEFVISLRTVESHIAALRRKLGCESRSSLVDAARARRRAALPLPLNSFLGRARDQSVVADLLDRHRWVSVVGPPGCGKTRLALEVASRGARDPILVELTGTPRGQVGDTIAGSLGVGRSSDTSLTRALAAALSTRRPLLVLDGCERVAPDVVAVVRELLVSVHDLAVLTTSQGPLDASDEVVHRTWPLSGEDDAERAAVTLLLDRATSARGGRPPEDPDWAPRLCAVLDGLPLAIELVAARAGDVSLRQLAETITADRALLDVGGPLGERSLASAFSRSWDVLPDEDRQVLVRVAALPSRFDLDLAASVVGLTSPAAVLRLVARSMISADQSPDAGPASFLVLPSLRPLILAHADAGLEDAVRRAHAQHCRDDLGELAAHARTDDSHDTMLRARRALAAAPPALDWATEHDPELAAGLAVPLGVLVEQYGADSAAVAAVTRAVGQPSVMSHLLGPDGDLAGEALLYSEVRLAGDLATQLLASAADPRTQLAAHRLACFVLGYQGSLESARSHAIAAERLATSLHDVWRLASARQGYAMATEGSSAEQLTAFRSALEAFAIAGDALHVNNVRYMMALTQIDAGTQREQAEEWLAQCVAYANDTDNRHELAHALLTRARLRPDSPTTPDDLAAARDEFANVGDLRCLARTHLALAQLATPERAVPLLRTAVGLAAYASATSIKETALTALVHCAWEAGQTREAALALGELMSNLGREDALATCPSGLRSQIDTLEPQVLEGMARARSQASHWTAMATSSTRRDAPEQGSP